jgi:hypothetical protein
MRKTRRVAQFARKAGFGQPQRASDSPMDSQADHRDSQKSRLGQPDQPNQPDSDHPYMRDAHLPSNETVISHVRCHNEADQTDQADQGRETAGLRGWPQADHRLTEAPVSVTKTTKPRSPYDGIPIELHARWIRVEPEPIAWTDRDDVRLVVEDLADERMRSRKIARMLGLRRDEVLGLLRRFGR